MTKTNDRILTRHPEGKQGVRIARDKYEGMKRALLEVVPLEEEGVPFRELTALVEPRLDREVFEGASTTWYLVAVKQDLEARGALEKVPDARPQRVRRTE